MLSGLRHFCPTHCLSKRLVCFTKNSFLQFDPLVLLMLIPCETGNCMVLLWDVYKLLLSYTAAAMYDRE